MSVGRGDVDRQVWEAWQLVVALQNGGGRVLQVLGLGFFLAGFFRETAGTLHQPERAQHVEREQVAEEVEQPVGHRQTHPETPRQQPACFNAEREPKGQGEAATVPQKGHHNAEVVDARGVAK